METNKYLNREIALLQFHERVLDNAFDTRHPLFNRLMFLSIAGRNMDEYYMLKYPGITTLLENNIYFDDAGYDLNELLKEVTARTYKIMKRMNEAADLLIEEMNKEQIYIRKIAELNKKDILWLRYHFMSYIKPYLTPTILDSTHPFPMIPNGTLNVLFRLENKDGGSAKYMIIMIPGHLDRFVKLSKPNLEFVSVEDLIIFFSDLMIPSGYMVTDSSVFKLLRDNNITIEEYVQNVPVSVGGILKKKRNGKIVKLVTLKGISPIMERFFRYNFDITSDQMFILDKYIALNDYDELVSQDRKDLVYPVFKSRFPHRITNFNGDYFKAIAEKDLLVHTPFESFDVFLGFLHQAAHDPQVVLIKQTLYRTSADFQIVQELIEAAENGKQVVALVEIRASMDEENNVYLARMLEENGIQVVYGALDYKTHAKICLVVRQDNHKIEEYLHLGTGNYHPQTAKVYTDFSLFTCNPVLCEEVNDVFNYITGFIQPKHQSKVFVSPLTLKSRLLELINQEIDNKGRGKPAGIWFKCNGLVDIDIIDALCRASQAGVNCELVIRGICCLRPGIPGYSENIRVISVVGRFLEHSRMYAFANGEEMPSLKNKVFISSADLMPKNLVYRIEVMAEIENPTVQLQLLNEIFAHYLKDTKNSWLMQNDGRYIRVSDTAEEQFDVHEYLMTHESLSGQGAKF